MEILGYLLLMIGGTVVCASAFPFCEYLYHRFVKKETYTIRYYYSQTLYDIHCDIHFKQYGIHPSRMCRVINNRKELAKMWEKELEKDLP